MNNLKEALKKLGIETAEQLNEAIKKEKPLDIGIMTSELVKEGCIMRQKITGQGISSPAGNKKKRPNIL
jgi:hypothetical protein